MTDDAPSAALNRTKHQEKSESKMQRNPCESCLFLLFKSWKAGMPFETSFLSSCVHSLIPVHQSYALHLQANHSLELLPIQTCAVRQPPQTLDLSRDMLPHGVLDV